jgi:hypothetical protein
MRAPFYPRGTWYVGGGTHIPGTLIDKRRGALVVGHLSEIFHEEDLEGRAPLLGNPKDEVFERYVKCPVNGPPPP